MRLTVQNVSTGDVVFADIGTQGHLSRGGSKTIDTSTILTNQLRDFYTELSASVTGGLVTVSDADTGVGLTAGQIGDLATTAIEPSTPITAFRPGTIVAGAAIANYFMGKPTDGVRMAQAGAFQSLSIHAGTSPTGIETLEIKNETSSQTVEATLPAGAAVVFERSILHEVGTPATAEPLKYQIGDKISIRKKTLASGVAGANYTLYLE